jgi:hypothetical protein
MSVAHQQSIYQDAHALSSIAALSSAAASKEMVHDNDSQYSGNGDDSDDGEAHGDDDGDDGGGEGYDDDSQEATDVHSRNHATLGQMADQIQAKARREQIHKTSGDGPDRGGGDDVDNDADDDDDGEVDPSICTPGTEQTGRWTRKEHELFLDALKKFGKVIEFRHCCIIMMSH